MKIHKVNKRIDHNQTRFEKGEKIKESHGDFEYLQKAGHIDSQDVSKDIEDEEKAEGPAPESEEKSEQSAKPHGKPRR